MPVSEQKEPCPMGFNPVHQRRCGPGFQANGAPSSADHLVSRLPVICKPNSGYTLTEFADSLEGVTPQRPTFTFDPENWYYV
jgi:hypothetical protein